jgi:hypothetical protein
MPLVNPNYEDGLQAVVDLSIYCYNNGATYITFSGDPSEGSQVFEIRNSNNQLTGSVTFKDARTGTISCQYTLAADELPGATNLMRAGYIISFRSRYYVVGQVKETIEKNQVIKFTIDVTELQNPFIPSLLSTLGQQLSQSNANANLPITVNCVASGTRPNATLSYSAETYPTRSSSAPTGITINANTGILTVANTAVVGISDVRVIVSDMVTLPDGTSDTVYGWGRLTQRVT